MFKGVRQNGRVKGQLNKTTTDVKKIYSQILENNIENIQSDLDKLDPLNRIKILIQLSEFIVPKMRSIDVVADVSTINIQPLIIDLNDKN
jgi:hypothetical protein